MSEIFERISVYILGGLSGVALGLILLSFTAPHLERETYEAILFTTALAGVVLAVSILEYKKEKAYKASQKVWNEAIALITHEMRTGLTSTSWAIQLILQNYTDKMSEEDRRMLNNTIASINTTVMHTVNLLDISLLNIGTLSITREHVSLADVERIFKEIIQRFSAGAERSGIHFVSEVHLDAERHMEADLMRLRIILENLLENAIKYSIGDKKEITVTVSNDASAMHITIQDTGIGIPEADRTRIFSEFFRAANARKKLSSGSGIGLHMCSEYVKAHHGTIRFESKENEGTTFYVSLPLAAA